MSLEAFYARFEPPKKPDRDKLAKRSDLLTWWQNVHGGTLFGLCFRKSYQGQNRIVLGILKLETGVNESRMSRIMSRPHDIELSRFTSFLNRANDHPFWDVLSIHQKKFPRFWWSCFFAKLSRGRHRLVIPAGVAPQNRTLSAACNSFTRISSFFYVILFV